MGFFNLRRGGVRVFGLFSSISWLILAAVSLVLSIFGLVLASGACFKHFWARFSILGSVLSIFGLVLAFGAHFKHYYDSLSILGFQKESGSSKQPPSLD